MKFSKKGQSAVEFIILIGVVGFFFLGFLVAIQKSLAGEEERNIDFLAKEIALNVQNEISIASGAIDGYWRNFSIPQKILSFDYDVNVVSQSFVYINTTDGRHGLSLPVANVTGNIRKGGNVIEKINSTVYLNR